MGQSGTAVSGEGLNLLQCWGHNVPKEWSSVCSSVWCLEQSVECELWSSVLGVEQCVECGAS